jgi:prepilin-type N-terminal cleavage/methylation domain-containing protein
MNRRQGFTLMELLLVVAVLAIVAAAAAPTFFSGATEAMEEARKASFLSSYQNTVSGANMALSMMAARGETITEDSLDDDTLAKYAPVAARTFKNLNDKDVVLKASIATSGTEGSETMNNNILITAYIGSDQQGKALNPTSDTNMKSQLDTLWDDLKNK